MKGRILVLAFALGLLAAPALGALATDSCSACCHRAAAEDPCAADGSPCAALATAPCCEAAPTAAVPTAQRTGDTPSLLPPSGWERAVEPLPQRAHRPALVADLVLRTSPLRLSVVLLI